MQTAATLRRVAAVRSHDVLHHSSGGHAIPYAASTLRYYEDQGLLTNVERTETGQRIYEDCHIDRLRAICCFKNAGMTIDDLKKFFVYESNEPEHIDEILDLLESRRESLDEQRRALNEAAMHVQRKLHYYGDIKRAIDAGEDWPDWREYKNRAYSIEC